MDTNEVKVNEVEVEEKEVTSEPFEVKTNVTAGPIIKVDPVP